MKKNQGFSLVEMMVAMFIIAIAVLMFSYFMNPLRQTKESQKETQQLALARNYLDNLRGLWQSVGTTDCAYVSFRLPSPTDYPRFRLSVSDPSDTTNTPYFVYDSSLQYETFLPDYNLLRNVTFEFLNPDGTSSLQVSTQIARLNPRPNKCEI